MAYLIDPLKQYKVYLHSYHSFGRKIPGGWSRVDTALTDRSVSRQHAFIECINDAWILRDTSLNGILVNDQPLPAKEPYRLQVHDSIIFGDPKLGCFTVADLSPYQPFLLPRPNNLKDADLYKTPPYSTACRLDERALMLNEYQLLPCEQNPDVCIFRDSGRWMLEHLQTGTEQRLNNGGMLWIEDKQWQAFVTSHLAEETQAITPPKSAEAPEFMFKLTQDEETTALNIRYHGEKVELGSRAHHYPLVLLARKRIDDLKNGRSPDDSGWVFRSQLARMLGVDANHLNILLHRLRKQLAQSADNAAALSALELKDRQVRFGEVPVTIHKGEKLEVVYSP